MVPEVQPEPRTATILLVEDEIIIRLALTEALRRSGLKVVEASSADQALSYLSAGGTVDLIVTDIQMPGSRNGLDLARHVRATWPMIPIVLTTGNAQLAASDQFDALLPKPYDAARVAHLVRTLLPADGEGNAP